MEIALRIEHTLAEHHIGSRECAEAIHGNRAAIDGIDDVDVAERVDDSITRL